MSLLLNIKWLDLRIDISYVNISWNNKKKNSQKEIY
jgi:hypothetical protein